MTFNCITKFHDLVICISFYEIDIRIILKVCNDIIASSINLTINKIYNNNRTTHSTYHNSVYHVLIKKKSLFFFSKIKFKTPKIRTNFPMINIYFILFDFYFRHSKDILLFSISFNLSH